MSDYKGSIREVRAISVLSARMWNAQPREAMISIRGSSDPPVPLKKGWVDMLRLQFDDIEKPTPGLKLFSEEDADKVIDFIQKIDGKVDHVVVHCMLGQSRGPGVARAITLMCGLTNGLLQHMTFNRRVCETIFWRWRHRFFPGQGGAYYGGPVRADHPIYSTGPVVNGRPLFPPPAKKEEG